MTMLESTVQDRLGSFFDGEQDMATKTKQADSSRNGTSRNGTGTKPLQDTIETPATLLTPLEEKQAMLAHMVRLVARKVSVGLFVFGTGGTGKSKVITETLASEGIVPVLVNSHVTPLALYYTLFQNRTGQVVWLDDCDSIYANLMILGILRSALWGQGERIVTYNSSQLDGAPASFVFDSRVIFCANTVPKRNEAFKAVLSRVDVFELSATNEEIIQQMRALATRGFGTLTPETCTNVVEFIAGCGGTRQLSMRLYEPSLKKVEYALANGIDWKELVRSQLDQLGQQDSGPKAINTKAHDLSCLVQAMEAYPGSVRDQQDFWCQDTGKSRASFFRVKAEYDKEQGGGK
jgi:hypothetical protein